MKFHQVPYAALNDRQKEIFNFQKVSGVLADYGFATLKLSDDWNGADFLAVHIDGRNVLRVQLKGRLTFEKKYAGKDLWVCFRRERHVYLYPHDKTAADVLVVADRLNQRRYDMTKSWNKDDGGYSFPSIPKWLLPYLKQHLLGIEAVANDETTATIGRAAAL